MLLYGQCCAAPAARGCGAITDVAVRRNDERDDCAKLRRGCLWRPYGVRRWRTAPAAASLYCARDLDPLYMIHASRSRAVSRCFAHHAFKQRPSGPWRTLVAWRLCNTLTADRSRWRYVAAAAAALWRRQTCGSCCALAARHGVLQYSLARVPSSIVRSNFGAMLA